MNQSSETYVPRITQLDANVFDKEIHNLLKNTVLEIGKYLKPGFLNNVKPEINLLINLLVFKYSLLKCNSSFGQQLLNVQYDEKLTGKKAIWFSLLNFLIPYLKSKFYEDVSSNWKISQVRPIMDKIEMIVEICQLLNLINFLRNGVFPNVVDRILGLKIVNQKRLNRNVGYSYMTRELIWHGFMELFTFVVPLINYQYLKKKLYKTFIFKSNKSTIQKSVIFNSSTTCSICGELPVYPCRISLYCEHVACYYCIKSNVLADPEYICSICGVKNTADMLLNTLCIQ